MLFTALLAAFLPALAVAQSGTSSGAVPTSTGSIPPCALSCTVQNAGNSACGGIGNVTCLCTNSQFQASVLACYQSTCSATDLQAAESYGSALCASNGTPITVSSAGPSESASASSSSASASASGSSSAQSSSRAQSSSAASSSAAASSSSQPSASASNSSADKVAFGVNKMGVATAIAGFFLGAAMLL